MEGTWENPRELLLSWVKGFKVWGFPAVAWGAWVSTPWGVAGPIPR